MSYVFTLNKQETLARMTVGPTDMYKLYTQIICGHFKTARNFDRNLNFKNLELIDRYITPFVRFHLESLESVALSTIISIVLNVLLVVD